MTTELTQNNETSMTHGDYLGAENILPEDFIIPKLFLMQGQSKFVAERKAGLGDIVRSTTAEKVGDPESPLKIIPLTFKNLWLLEEKVKGSDKKLYRGVLTRDSGMHDGGKSEIEKTGTRLPFQFQHEGQEWVRTKTVDVFCLLSQDLAPTTVQLDDDLPDLSKTVMPVLLRFKGTSFLAGAKVVTHFSVAAQSRSKPHYYQLDVTCKLVENDKGTFYIFDDARYSGPVPKEKRAETDRWYQVVTSQKVKVDESEDQTVEAPASKEEY